MVEAGHILMACSGQLYGLVGNAIWADAWHEKKIISNHVLRIISRSDVQDAVRPGYLQMAIAHPELGRPAVLRYAFGTEVPELAPQDIAGFPVIRLSPSLESSIADSVERASHLRSRAGSLEAELTDAVDEYLQGLLRKSSTGYPKSIPASC